MICCRGTGQITRPNRTLAAGIGNIPPVEFMTRKGLKMRAA
jgi:hypothetical protein